MQDGDLLLLMNRLAPAQVEEIGRHAQVLTGIDNMQPVGRRALASRLHLPEREVRTIAANLKNQGLLTLDAAGMQLTEQAHQVLPGARELSRALFGLTDLEQALSKLLHIPHVVVVSGDADKDSQILREVGRAAAHRIRQLLQNGMTLAVAGGHAMSETARGMHHAAPVDVMVVPARGGMGTSVENQANTIAAEMAHRLSGRYRVMHVPDNLDAAALSEMLKLPEVKEVIQLMEQAHIIAHGVGRADVMAQKRHLPGEIVHLLQEGGAVGEAFGDFFDESGRTVYQLTTVGSELARHEGSRMVAVAAGSGKAHAIIASARHEPHDSLITDEGAAGRILSILQAT